MAPDQLVKSIILPSRKILVQEMPTRTTEKPLLLMNITVVVIKVKGTDEIFEGYNPLGMLIMVMVGRKKLMMALFFHCKIAIYWIQYLAE
ncbi:hypothetical protein Glove_229g112 [Diversispora epigaea]|uniref:Uncharacterized protein n=1 Tax=Diversispora epigaea TaxID=1348612 RepID=A0A397IL62_9GLOM|nr:hypothetical protein Glove_229g112 [Diversispora epigaea]